MVEAINWERIDGRNSHGRDGRDSREDSATKDKNDSREGKMSLGGKLRKESW